MPQERTATGLAKLSRPRLYDALARERLFQQLDDKRIHPAVWITGPPGSGKTTLVGSYLENRAVAGVWFQVDAGDRDITTFFYYLTLTSGYQRRQSVQLRTPAPEQLHDLAGFARGYFRRYFSDFPENSVLVLDNVQEAIEQLAFQVIVDQMILEVPPTITLLFISRSDPPSCFASHLAARRVAILSPDLLKFSEEETRHFFMQGTECTDNFTLRVVEQLDGWAAGLVLVSERMRAAGAEYKQDTTILGDAVFDYFAAWMLEDADPATKNVMLCTAFLPYVTPEMAVKVSGDPNAHDTIDQLYQRHLFVNRRADNSYEYHTLFREFLLGQACLKFEPGDLCALRVRAADALLAAGNPDAAFVLFVSAGNWIAARRLVLAHAGDMLRDGRWEIVQHWLAALRPEDFDVDPWLVYWHGMTELAIDAPRSLAIFEDAYRRFSAIENRTGAFMSVARILAGYFLAWDTVEALDPWISIMEGLIEGDQPVADEAMGYGYGNMLIALLYRKPAHSLLPVCARWVANNLDAETDPARRLELTTYLLHYYGLMGAFEKSPRLIEGLKRLLANQDIAPSVRMMAWVRYCVHCLLTGKDPEAALQAAEAAATLARESGLPDSLIAFTHTIQAHTRNGLGNWRGAQDALEKARVILPESQRVILIHFYWAELWTSVLSGDMSRTSGLWNDFAKVPPVGVPINTAYNLPAIYFLSETGRADEALERAARWTAALTGMKSPLLDFNLSLMRAYPLLKERRHDEVRAELSVSLKLAAAHGFATTLAWVPQMMSSLLAFALAHRIEPDYVRALIKKHQLPAPGAVATGWPWPLEVKALGGFAVLREGERIEFAKRPQHRTMELLKAIVAFGVEDVSATKVMTALWPDADGDAAQRAFSVALHRLRKLLGNDQAIRLSDGVLSIDVQTCRVDVRAFTRLTEQIEGEDVSLDDDAAAEQLFVLYRGHFLDNDSEPWMLACRETLGAKFHRSVRILGKKLESENRWNDALDLYRHVVELDALVEEFYSHMMRCLLEQGRFAECMDVYRRCREMLSIVLGVAPSLDTQALFRNAQSPSGRNARV